MIEDYLDPTLELNSVNLFLFLSEFSQILEYKRESSNELNLCGPNKFSILDHGSGRTQWPINMNVVMFFWYVVRSRVFFG